MTQDQNVAAPLPVADDEDFRAAQKIIQDAEETLRSIAAESLTLPESSETVSGLGDRFEWTRLAKLAAPSTPP
ncbi:MAG TPA: hypothetical protein VNZ61_00300 [Roseomonas sp.]|nr:hypothetical protein [Roseomonas sp.]